MFSLLFSASCSSLPLISGTFIQSWFHMWWDEARWDKEMEMLSNLGMKYLVFQSTGAEKWIKKDESLSNDDWANFKYDTSSPYNNHVVYPTQAFNELTYVGHDSLGTALKLCKKYNMQLFIGGIADDRFFNYGWDTARNHYFTTWQQMYTESSKKLFNEIWNMYSEYRDQIAGFYFYSEYWNFDIPCGEKYEGAREEWSEVYAQYLHDYDTMIAQVTQGTKPMLISPFKNFDLSNYEQYGLWLDKLLTKAKMRETAIFSPQDSMGGWFSKKSGELKDWTRVEKEACDAAGIRFWINNENFRDNYGTAPFSEFVEQVKLTNVAETHIMFAVSHYGSGNSETESEREWHNNLKKFIEESENEETSSKEEDPISSKEEDPISSKEEDPIEQDSSIEDESEEEENKVSSSYKGADNKNKEKLLPTAATVAIAVVAGVVIIAGIIAGVLIIKKRKDKNNVDLEGADLAV